MRFPLTVVVTTNALLGQWHDELTKFAPSLRVKWYYGQSTKHGTGAIMGAKADAEQSTPASSPRIRSSPPQRTVGSP